MDVIEISKQIELKIKQLELGRQMLREVLDERAIKISNYEKMLAITMIKLKNGEELSIEGNKIVNPPATSIEKISRGICYKEKLEMEEADAKLKAHYVKINALTSELMALQNLNKNLKYEA